MLLTIDVGNTHTVLGLFDGEEIVEHWRISTDARRTADELAVLLQGLMGMHPLLGEELGDGIDGIAICATVPSVEMRQCSTISSPSNRPRTVCVLPTSMVSSMAGPTLRRAGRGRCRGSARSG